MLSKTKEKDIINLIETGQSINQKDSKGQTLLHYSFIRNNNLKEFLLKNGADANVKNLNGQSPLYFAKTVDDVALLIKYGALITTIDIHGKKAYDVNPVVKQFMTMMENKFKNL